MHMARHMRNPSFPRKWKWGVSACWGSAPIPAEHWKCVLETLESSSGYAILQIAKWVSTPVLFRFSRHGERIVSKNPIYICLCSLKGTHILPCLLVLCVHGFFLRQELGIFCLQALNGGQLFQPLLIKGLLVSLRRRIALVLPQKLRNLLCSSRAVEFQITWLWIWALSMCVQTI